MRRKRALRLSVAFVCVALALSACTRPSQTEFTRPTVTTSSPDASSSPSTATPSAAASASAESTSPPKPRRNKRGRPVFSPTPAKIGAPYKAGSWTLTVTSAEFAKAKSGGGPVLKVEVSLRNDAASAQKLVAMDFFVRSKRGDMVIPTTTAQGTDVDRTVAAGATEDMRLVFPVATSKDVYTLYYSPSQGGPGSLAVPLP